MRIADARRMARALMDQHGLTGWTLVLDNAKTRAGVCRPGRREIGLSRVLTELHTEDEVRDTVLHEIAHALVGAEHGHDAVWRAKAVAIGCSGMRCVPETAARVEGPWEGTCPAGHVVTRHRRPRRVQSCRRCAPSFDPSALIEWTWRGQPVPMHPDYVAELAQITRSHVTDGPTDLAPVAAQLALLPQERGAAEPARAPSRDSARGQLPVGARVVLGGAGKYAGVSGVVVKRGRTRYHVQTRMGLLTVPFALATRT